MVDGSDCPKQGSMRWGEASVLRRTGQASQLPGRRVSGYVSPQGYTLLIVGCLCPWSAHRRRVCGTARQCGMPPDLPFKTKPELARR